VNSDLTITHSREVAQQQPVNALELIRELILDERVKPERIAALMDLQERAEAREAERQFNVDFAAAMAEMPTILKDKVKDMGTKGSIPYASYENVDKIVRRIELKYGFCRTFSTERTEKACSLMTVTLLHKGGHSIKSTRYQSPDPGPGRNDAQAQGSSDSYNKRYLTLGIWNIVTVGADDDGNSMDLISDQQLSNITNMLNACDVTGPALAKFLEFASAPKVEQIKARDYDRVMQALRQKQAARK
jgi:hypothetical protein